MRWARCLWSNFGSSTFRASSRALHASEPAKQRGQIFPVHVLHGQEGLAVDFRHVVDTADHRVADLAGHPDFVVEALEPVGIEAEVRG